MTNHELANYIYQQTGQDGVFNAVHHGAIKCDGWHYCKPCEVESPYEDHACLVCGTQMEVVE